jgi:hypothetical protein
MTRLTSRRRLARYGALIFLAGLLAGCVEDVTMRDPQTGRTEICPQSLRGLDPWSQTMSCVANHEAEGWVRARNP